MTSATGVAVFVAWRLTGEPALIETGIHTILIGAILGAVGMVLLRFFQTTVATDSAVSTRQASLRIKLGVGLLLSNFPLAAALATIAFGLLTSPRIEIRNESSSPLTDLALIHHERRILLDDIPPGGTGNGRIRHPSDGSVSLRGKVGSEGFEAIVIGYTTNNDGSRWRVTVHSAEAIFSERLNR